MAKIADMGEKITETVVEGYKKIETKFSKTFLDGDGSLKTGKVGEAVVGSYKKIEDGVVAGYKKIEEGVVSGFSKVNDKIIETVFSKDGESVENTKARLSGEEKAD